MRKEIRHFHQALGTTIVYVTHDQVEAMTLASRVAVMRDGVVQQFADPQTIYDSPANLFVAVFMAVFMGSPPMNAIPALLKTGIKVGRDGGGRHTPDPIAPAGPRPRCRLDRPSRAARHPA